MTFSLLASRFWMYARALGGSLISVIIFITCSLAPPCGGPLSAAIAAVVAEWMSLSVAAHTRAANVDAFMVWSAWSVRQRSKMRAWSSSGLSPVSMYRKLAAWVRFGSGVT